MVIIILLNNFIIFSLCDGVHRKSQLLFFIDAMLIGLCYILTSGIFLSGYIILLGGSDFIVGFLNSSAIWGSFTALFSFLIYERLSRRKTLLIVFFFISRILSCSIIFLPIVSNSSSLILTMTTCMVIIGNVLWGIFSIGFVIWIMEILNEETRNRYMFLRMSLIRISFTIASLIMGFVLDKFGKTYTGFFIVFCTSLVLSIADGTLLVSINEAPNTVSPNMKETLKGFFEPLKDQLYRAYLVFILLFYFCYHMAFSFISVYMIRYLRLEYSFMSTIQVVEYISMALFTGVWGVVYVKKGPVNILKITSGLLILQFLISGFLTKNTYYLLFITSFLHGVWNSGFTVVSMTMRYELMPEGGKTIYEGWHGAVIGFSTFTAPVTGSLLLGVLPVIDNSIIQFGNFQLLFIVSAVLLFFVMILSAFACFNRRNCLQWNVKY